MATFARASAPYVSKGGDKTPPNHPCRLTPIRDRNRPTGSYIGGPAEPEEAAEQSESVERTVLEDLVELAVTEEPADWAEHMVLIAPEALEEAMGMR